MASTLASIPLTNNVDMTETKPSTVDASSVSNTSIDSKALTARLNPTARSRLLIVLSFPLLLLVGLPFWYYTTSIVRLPLPTARIHALEQTPYTNPRTAIHLTVDEEALPRPPPEATYNHTSAIQALGKDIEHAADDLLSQSSVYLRGGRRQWDIVTAQPEADETFLRIHIGPTSRADGALPLQPYFQPVESGSVQSGIAAGTLVVPVHPNLSGKPLMPKQYVQATVKALSEVFPTGSPWDDIPRRALKYAPNVTLSFVLLNEDSSQEGYVRSWDLDRVLNSYFLPELESLGDIFNFTIESQILYHAPLSFDPSYGPLEMPILDSLELSDTGPEKKADATEVNPDLRDTQRDHAWRITEDETKIFVNSERWSLDSGSTNNPVLRCLLFVPSAKHRPMRIDVPNAANSFLIPQYGSVVILNPPPSSDPDTVYHLHPAILGAPFRLFKQHLLDLLALPNYSSRELDPIPRSYAEPPYAFHQPMPPWEIEQIYRMRTKENSDEARKTLAGIVRLVKKIGEMKVESGVRDKVLGAVDRLERMDTATNMREAFLLSRDAVGLANEAFFDPSMMGLLYFPDEHKFAVYTPLFAPVALPVVVGLAKEFLAWRRRRRVAKSTDAVATDSLPKGDKDL